MVIDSSALLAIVLGEPESNRCMDALEADGEVLISAGTMAEALIVAGHRGVRAEVASLIDDLNMTVVPLTASGARRVAESYARWGKGRDPAALNFGDCFAHALAEEQGAAVLFVGNDFSKTNVEAA